jgi:uncharacterized protein (TIGR02145 family)
MKINELNPLKHIEAMLANGRLLFLKIILALFLLPICTYGQSKKEQIAQLNQKIDSLFIVSQAFQFKTDSLTRVITNSEKLFNQTKDELEAKLGQLERYQIQNQINYTELENDYESLKQNFEVLSNKSLEKDRFITKKTSLKDSIINSLQNANQLLSNTIKASNIKTIKIGTQIWMQDDLKETHYNNGDLILQAQTPEIWEDYGKRGLGCYRVLSNGTYTYNGYALDDKRGIVPAGYVVPTYYDFETLFKFLGGGNSRNGKAVLSMATYPINFDSHDGEKGPFKFISNGKSGFNAKKGGFVYNHGDIDGMWNYDFNCSYWWTSTSEKIEWRDEVVGAKRVVDIGYCSQDLGGGFNGDQTLPLSFGFAVRPIKKIQDIAKKEDPNLNTSQNFKSDVFKNEGKLAQEWTFDSSPLKGIDNGAETGEITFFIRINEKGNVTEIRIDRTNVKLSLAERYKKLIKNARFSPKSEGIRRGASGFKTIKIVPTN